MLPTEPYMVEYMEEFPINQTKTFLSISKPVVATMAPGSGSVILTFVFGSNQYIAKNTMKDSVGGKADANLSHNNAPST